MLISYALLLSLLFTRGLPAVAYPDSHQYFDTPPIEPAYIDFTREALASHGFAGVTLIRVNPLAPEKIWREFHTDGLDYTLRFVSEPGALMIQYGLVNRDDSGRVIGEISVVWQEERILGGAFNPPVSGYWCKMRSDLLDNEAPDPQRDVVIHIQSYGEKKLVYVLSQEQIKEEKFKLAPKVRLHWHRRTYR